jgi:hypothetical protein
MTNFGYTPRQVYNIFRSLRKDVFKEFRIPARSIAFTARPYSEWELMKAEWDYSIADTHFNPATHVPYGISLNMDFMSYAWEDEIRGVILHEMAHVIAGWDADHGPVWAGVAEYIGSVSNPHYLLREWKRMPKILQPSLRQFRVLGGPTFGEVEG